MTAPEQLRQLLEAIAQGAVSPDAAYDQLKTLQFEASRGSVNGRRRLLFELRIAIFIQSSFQSPLELIWKRFGTNFGTILGAKAGHQSIIDSIRSRIYAKSIFERNHQCFEWFLLSRRSRNSTKF